MCIFNVDILTNIIIFLYNYLNLIKWITSAIFQEIHYILNMSLTLYIINICKIINSLNPIVWNVNENSAFLKYFYNKKISFSFRNYYSTNKTEISKQIIIIYTICAKTGAARKFSKNIYMYVYFKSFYNVMTKAAMLWSLINFSI